MLPSTQRGGTEEYALTIASAAAKDGCDVHAAFPQTDGTTSLVEDFVAEGICYHPLEIPEPSNYRLGVIGTLFPRFLRTIALLLKLKPDIVSLSLPWAEWCLGSILACGFLKIPTVVVIHLIPYKFAFGKKRLKVYSWAINRKQQWVAISEKNRQFICESFQIPYEQVPRIYNGTKLPLNLTNIGCEEIATVRSQVRQELGIPEASQIALTVGRLEHQKGYSDLVPVIPHVVKEFSNMWFVWAGDGSERDYFVSKVQEYGVQDKVLFLGYRSDVQRLLKAADLFVFPTHFEGLPFALIEAMAYSLPIVSSDASSIPEIIENKVHGILFRSGDSCDLLEAIRWALKHPDDMHQMAQNAQQRAQEFSEERMVKETLEVLQNFSFADRGK